MEKGSMSATCAKSKRATCWKLTKSGQASSSLCLPFWGRVRVRLGLGFKVKIGLRTRLRKRASLPQNCAELKRPTYQMPKRRGWAGFSLCLSSKGKLRVWLGSGLGFN